MSNKLCIRRNSTLMQSHKGFVCLALCVVLGTTGCASITGRPALPCPATQSPQLEGLWESEDKSNGGIGHTLELRSDGTFVEAVTVIVDWNYRVSGDRIIINEEPIADAFRFKFEGDTFVVESPGLPTVRKERIWQREHNQAPIVGMWRYRHYTGAVAFERYTPEGRLHFRLPMSSSQGFYTLEGTRLTLDRPGQKKAKVSFEWRGTDLALTFPGQRAVIYHKDPAGPWYERERIDYQPPNP